MSREVYVTESFVNEQIRLLFEIEKKILNLGSDHEDLLIKVRIVRNQLIDAKLAQWYDAIDVDEEYVEQAILEMRNKGAL